MFHRSLKKKRPMIWNAWCIVLLTVCAMPRLTIHSHAGLGQSGMDAMAIAQHVQFFHAQSQSALPPDAVHVHWLLGTCAEASLVSFGSANSGSNDAGHDQVMVLDYSLVAEAVGYLGAAGILYDVGSFGNFQSVDDVRVRFCVWTC